MTDEPFLPEDDQDFLRKKGILHRFHSDGNGDQLRRAIELADFGIPSNLYKRDANGSLVPAIKADILILIPKGYSKTRLDSWYVNPALVLANGSYANCASAQQNLFGKNWQFWSRHLTDIEWRPGIDGLETYFQYIRGGLQNP